MKKGWIALLVLLSLSLLAIGCGGSNNNGGSGSNGGGNSGGGSNGGGNSSEVTIKIDPPSKTIVLGESVDLTVAANNTDILWPDLPDYTHSGTTATFTPTIVGTYTFTVTAAASTSKKATALITVTPVDTTPGIHSIDVRDAVATSVWGINDSGQIIGQYLDAAGKTRGFSLDDGVYTFIDHPNAIGTEIYKINNSGQLTGVAWMDEKKTYGFVKDNGSPTFANIENPVAEILGGTAAYGINDAGQVVGNLVSNEELKGYLYDGSTHTFVNLIDFPENAKDSWYFDVNNSGQIAGYYTDAADKDHGFVYEAGSYKFIDYSGATNIQVAGINDAGQVVGDFTDAAGRTHGFVYDASTDAFTSFDYPGAATTAATDINNAGQVVGFYSDVNKRIHAFVLDNIIPAP
jgi:probable HAF family extracellular repeat protein